MKKYLILFLIPALFSCVSGGEDREEEYEKTSIVKVGQTIPDFTVDNGILGGGVRQFTSPGDLDVADYTFIVFFSTGCGDCHRDLPFVERLWDELGIGGGLGYLNVAAISRNEISDNKVADYWEEEEFDMPWYIDYGSAVYEKFASRFVPRFYLVDNTGKVVWMKVEDLKYGDYTEAKGKQFVEEIRAKMSINSAHETSSKIKAGDKAPSFSVDNGMDGGGSRVFQSPADLDKADYTFIVLFTTSCGDCQRELPYVERLWDDLGLDGGTGTVNVVAIGKGETYESVTEYWENPAKDFDMPWYVDTNQTAYGKFATGYVPRLYLVDQSGTVVWMKVENLGYGTYTEANGTKFVNMIKKYLK